MSEAQTDREAALLRLQLAILFHFGPLRLWPFANNRSTAIISQANCGLSLSMELDVRCIFTFHFHAVSSELFCVVSYEVTKVNSRGYKGELNAP